MHQRCMQDKLQSCFLCAMRLALIWLPALTMQRCTFIPATVINAACDFYAQVAMVGISPFACAAIHLLTQNIEADDQFDPCLKVWVQNPLDEYEVSHASAHSYAAYTPKQSALLVSRLQRICLVKTV